MLGYSEGEMPADQIAILAKDQPKDDDDAVKEHLSPAVVYNL